MKSESLSWSNPQLENAKERSCIVLWAIKLTLNFPWITLEFTSIHLRFYYFFLLVWGCPEMVSWDSDRRESPWIEGKLCSAHLRNSLRDTFLRHQLHCSTRSAELRRWGSWNIINLILSHHISFVLYCDSFPFSSFSLQSCHYMYFILNLMLDRSAYIIADEPGGRGREMKTCYFSHPLKFPFRKTERKMYSCLLIGRIRYHECLHRRRRRL